MRGVVNIFNGCSCEVFVSLMAACNIIYYFICTKAFIVAHRICYFWFYISLFLHMDLILDTVRAVFYHKKCSQVIFKSVRHTIAGTGVSKSGPLTDPGKNFFKWAPFPHFETFLKKLTSSCAPFALWPRTTYPVIPPVDGPAVNQCGTGLRKISQLYVSQYIVKSIWNKNMVA